MTDEIDQAELQIEAQLATRIALIRAHLSDGAGRANCIDCGEAIAAERRAALPNAVRCTPCQERFEKSR